MIAVGTPIQTFIPFEKNAEFHENLVQQSISTASLYIYGRYLNTARPRKVHVGVEGPQRGPNNLTKRPSTLPFILIGYAIG